MIILAFNVWNGMNHFIATDILILGWNWKFTLSVCLTRKCELAPRTRVPVFSGLSKLNSLSLCVAHSTDMNDSGCEEGAMTSMKLPSRKLPMIFNIIKCGFGLTQKRLRFRMETVSDNN